MGLDERETYMGWRKSLETVKCGNKSRCFPPIKYTRKNAINNTELLRVTVQTATVHLYTTPFTTRPVPNEHHYITTLSSDLCDCRSVLANLRFQFGY